MQNSLRQLRPYGQRSLLALVCFFALFGSRVHGEEEPLREPILNDDFLIEEITIPMRDEVKLYTIVMIPKNTD